MLDYRRTRTSGWGPRTARKWFFGGSYRAPRLAGRVDGVFVDVPPSGRAGRGPSRAWSRGFESRIG